MLIPLMLMILVLSNCSMNFSCEVSIQFLSNGHLALSNDPSIVPYCSIVFHFLGKLRRPHCDLTGIMVKRNHPKIQKKNRWVSYDNLPRCSINFSINFHLVGGLEYEWIIFPITLGMEKSSQLTFTPSFFRGVGIPWYTTNQIFIW